MDKGTLVIRITKNGVTCGIILETFPSKCLVLVDSGFTEQWGHEKLISSTKIKIKTDNQDHALQTLKRIKDTLLSLVQSIDLKEVWDIFADQPDCVSVEEIADLIFGMADEEQRLATALALTLDDIYFKQVEKGKVIPYSRKAVASILATKRHDAEENSLIREAVKEITEAIDQKDKTVKDEIIGWLKTVACSINDEKSSRRGKSLLELIYQDKRKSYEDRAIELLQKLGIFSEDEIIAIHKYNIKTEFPQMVEEEARMIAECPISADEMKGRIYLDETIGSHGLFAIDDPWTKDVDDAIMLEANYPPYKVHIVISDPTAKIPLDSKVGVEGAHRAETLYLPHIKLPMLPPILSENHLSLMVGQERPCIDFVCTLSKDGDVLDFEIRLVIAKLSRRLTYDEVDDLLKKDHEMSSVLRVLDYLAQRLREKRVQQGAVIIPRDDYDVKVVNGEVIITKIPWDSRSRNLIAEFMILACTQVGLYARQRGIPVIYRKQSPPHDMFASIGLQPFSRPYVYALLRSLSKAELTSFPDHHWGLGVIGYTQVTSPLRRFQDFLTHYQIKGYIRDGIPPLSMKDLMERFAKLESQAEINNRVEMEARNYWLLKVLEKKAKVTGEVVAIQGERPVVEIDDLGITMPAEGHANIGERVEIKVGRVFPRKGKASLFIQRNIP